MIHAFGAYELDLARIELRRSGVTLPIEPQVFDVLAYLVSAPRTSRHQGGAARQHLG